MKVDLIAGWVYFETAKGAKWRLRLDDVMAVYVTPKDGDEDEYLEIRLRSIPEVLTFFKGKPEKPSMANLGQEDGDFLTYEASEELEEILDEYIFFGKGRRPQDSTGEEEKN